LAKGIGDFENFGLKFILLNSHRFRERRRWT